MRIKNDFIARFFDILISLELILQVFFETFREEIMEAFPQIFSMLSLGKSLNSMFTEMIFLPLMGPQYGII